MPNSRFTAKFDAFVAGMYVVAFAASFTNEKSPPRAPPAIDTDAPYRMPRVGSNGSFRLS